MNIIKSLINLKNKLFPSLTYDEKCRILAKLNGIFFMVNDLTSSDLKVRVYPRYKDDNSLLRNDYINYILFKKVNNKIRVYFNTPWINFEISQKYIDDLESIINEFFDKVHDHHKVWDSGMSARGCKVSNIEFQKRLYEEYIINEKYLK